MSNNCDKKHCIFLVAGGTGGHIMPAVSFGQWIEKYKTDYSVQYICGSRPMERDIYESLGCNPTLFPVDGSPLSGSITRKAKRIVGQYISYKKSLEMLDKYKPDAVLLFGGYISFPMLFACRMRNIYCAIQEQNARAGKVTRIAAKMNTDIFSGWKECKPLSSAKYIHTGVPVRTFKKYSKMEACKKLSLPENISHKTVIVAFTGSLGSKSIKESIIKLSASPSFDDKVFILPAQADKIEVVSGNVVLMPKIWDAALIYSLADVLVMRAGGSTLTEASILNIPSVVIPWENAADDHQNANAEAFAAENNGIIWRSCNEISGLETAIISACGNAKTGKVIKNAEDISEHLWNMIYERMNKRGTNHGFCK